MAFEAFSGQTTASWTSGEVPFSSSLRELQLSFLLHLISLSSDKVMDVQSLGGFPADFRPSPSFGSGDPQLELGLSPFEPGPLGRAKPRA